MSNSSRNPLPLPGDIYLSDGGLETTLVFHQGRDLPCFASYPLVLSPEGVKTLTDYFQHYLELSRTRNRGFILETPTWRANTDWGAQLGHDQAQLDQINKEAVLVMKKIRETSGIPPNRVIVSGCMGPRWDGYVVGKIMSPKEAADYHRPQVKALAEAEVDSLSTFTLTTWQEAAGIVSVAKEFSLPIVVSFTVETDGRLPSGQTLKEAIEQVDRETENGPAFYMINCAHPTHFMNIFSEEGSWIHRIGGIRSNASKRSHAELETMTELDAGDPQDLAQHYSQLLKLLPQLRVVGGCCGTDHSHIEAICKGALD